MHLFGAALSRYQRCASELRSVEQAGGHVDAELVAAPASAGMTSEPCIEALRRVPTDRLSSYPSSRHAYIDETAVVMPDGVNARTESGN